MKIGSKSFIVKIGKRSCSIFLNRCMTFTFLCKEKRSENYGIAVWFYSGIRMHSSRMRTIRSSGRLSYNVHPPPCMPPAMYAPLPCMPHAMHAPAMHAAHACPSPCMPTPCMPPTLPCMPPHQACPCHASMPPTMHACPPPHHACPCHACPPENRMPDRCL